nr:MAG TPA: hypothetical protein [Caudoviricetes sp.]
MYYKTATVIVVSSIVKTLVMDITDAAKLLK